jgi:signal transduction histidine kinase
VVIIDFLHTLSYKGMGVFPSWSANHVTQFWILGRLLETAGLLLAIFIPGRNYNKLVAILLYSVGIIGIAMISTGTFPDCFIEGKGLTPFKIYSEYIIIGTLLLTMLNFSRIKNPEFLPFRKSYKHAFIFAILAELSFTMYSDIYGFTNMLGHIFRFISYYTIFGGIIINIIKNPISTLYHQLEEDNKKFREMNMKQQTLYENIKELEDFRVNFLRSISHELKTTLNVIYGNIQLMEMGVYGDVANLKEPLKALRNATKHSEELVNNLLDLSRAETGGLQVKMEPLTFSVFERVVKEYEQLAKQKGLEFKFKFEGKEPFSGDFMILSMILSNLLSNAVKYTDRGIVKGTLGADNEKLYIEVSDTGKGIPEEMREKIFQPFSSLSKERRSSGLGLAIVKKFTEIMGGKISLTSEEWKGSTFRVEICTCSQEEHDRKEHI